MTRPVAVLGLGGVGGMLAARTGALCIGTERTVAAIREHGLRLVQGDEAVVRHPVARTRLDTPVSLLVVAVKAYDLAAALDRVSPEALAGAVVLPLQNGLEHVAAIREWAEATSDTVSQAGSPSVAREGTERVHDGPAETASDTVSQGRLVVAAGSIGRVSVAVPEPGVVVQTTDAAAVLRAASRELAAAELAERLAPLAVPGLDLVVVDDEGDVLWEKAARLAVLAAATVASGLTVGPLSVDPVWRPRLETALAEACSVAAADGVPLDVQEQWAIITSLPHDLDTSAARDAAAGAPTELDAVAGSVVRAGARLGVPTPALTELLEEATCRAR